MQKSVQQRLVLHKNPTRGATIHPTYLRQMYNNAKSNNAKSPAAETFKKRKS